MTTGCGLGYVLDDDAFGMSSSLSRRVCAVWWSPGMCPRLGWNYEAIFSVAWFLGLFT